MNIVKNAMNEITWHTKEQTIYIKCDCGKVKHWEKANYCTACGKKLLK